MSYENYVCPKCNNKMIWGGDHDDDDVYDFYSTFSCSECKVTSVVYWNGDEEDE